MYGEIREQPAANNEKDWDPKLKLEAIQGQLNEVPDDSKSPPVTIFRLPMWYHETNKHLYEPKMVAIGPYHHGKVSLKAMEEHKLHSLQNFLNKNTNSNVGLKDYFNAVKKLENEACNCYSETVRMDGPAFVTMLLLDACFIIDYFEMLHGVPKKASSICHVGWANIYLYSDLFLLENQIPFFVIHKLLTLRDNLSDDCKSPCPLLKQFSAPLRRIFSTEKLSPPADLSCKEIHHLLDFYYKSMVLPSNNSQTTDEVDAESCHCWTNLFRWHELDGNRTASSDHEQGNQAAISSDLEQGNRAASSELEQGDNISCITELHDAGVTFKKKEKPSNMFDISFKNGVMEIPFLKVDDTHKLILWNMVAFEQSQIHIYKQILSSYLALMDSLINTEKDVAILERHGIIENYLQSSEDAAELFNQFAKLFVLDYSKHYYQELFKEIKEYSKSSWHKNWARLKHDYFPNPWTTLSVSAATALLLLTAAQTYFAAR